MWQQHRQWIRMVLRGLLFAACTGGVACCVWMLFASNTTQQSTKPCAVRVSDILVVAIELPKLTQPDRSQAQVFPRRDRLIQRGWLPRRREAFQMAVSVIEIEPDGQLVLEGQRQVSASGQPVETIFLSGKVRPECVGANKVILSSNMGPLEVERR